MIKAVIYDVDGTVLDTLSTIAYYGNQALEHFGFEPLPENNYKYYAGNGAKVLIERMLEDLGVSVTEYFDRTFEYYNKIYNEAPVAFTRPFDGISELVKALKAKGIRQAVISNKPDFATRGVMSACFNDEFDRVYGAREGVKLKPDPEALLSVLSELGVKQSECLYVGDTSVDMDTGKNADVTTVGVLWGFRTEEELRRHGADYIVENPMQILEIVNKINIAPSNVGTAVANMITGIIASPKIFINNIARPMTIP